jgi:hypothetical protein
METNSFSFQIGKFKLLSSQTGGFQLPKTSFFQIYLIALFLIFRINSPKNFIKEQEDLEVIQNKVKQKWGRLLAEDIKRIEHIIVSEFEI